MSKSKNDIAWEKLFDKYKIINKVLSDGHTIISSTNINEFREARLMTKFDHKSQLPRQTPVMGITLKPLEMLAGCLNRAACFISSNKV